MGWADSAKGNAQLEWGYQRVKCSRLYVTGRDGSPLTSKGGDPQVRVYYKGEAGGEGAVTYTLSEKAQWRLSRDLSRLGYDLDELDKSGVDLAGFADEETAKRHFLNRGAWCNVTPGSGKYPDIELCHESEVPPQFRDEPEANDEPPPVEDGPPLDDSDGEPTAGDVEDEPDPDALPF